MAHTLSEIQTAARNRADMENSEFISDAELTVYINESLGELYDILVKTYGVDNFLDAYEDVTRAGQTSYGLPTDFYKFAGLDLEVAGTYYTLTRFSHSDRLLYQNSGDTLVSGKPRFRYRIRKSTIDILPNPAAVYSFIMHYIPQVTKLVNTTDVIDNSIVDSWAEYVIVDTAMKMLIKEESDVQELMAIKAGLTQRIGSSARGRDLDIPEVVADSGNTLFNLRIQARYKSNMIGRETTLNSDLVSDRELTYYINQSLGELHDALTKSYDAHYFVDSYQFNTVSGTSEYSLPDDFYKLGGVDITTGGDTFSLSAYNFQERGVYDSSAYLTVAGAPYFNYHIQRNIIKLLPEPEGTYTITLWYSKTLSRLVNDSDTVNSVIVEEWLDMVTTGAAIRMLNKVMIGAQQDQIGGIKSSIQALTTSKAEAMLIIEKMAHDRDWGNPQTITDLTLKNSRFLWGLNDF